MNTTKSKFATRLISALAAALGLCAFTEKAEAQEILLTGPLAGAPAVRKLRLYRQGRFEFAPAVSFTLLDEYERHILLGARLTYNLTDWFGIGAWGAYGGLIRYPTSLVDHIQDENRERRAAANYENTVTGRILGPNLGADLEEQIGKINWVVSPQLTFTPFRGKLALFQSIYVDTDFYVFAGPAFVNVAEREECPKGECTIDKNLSFGQKNRTAISGTGGFGLTFYAAKWAGIGLEYRAIPFAWNKGGFDTAGGGKDKEFPDGAINGDDRNFSFNSMITLSFNVYLPAQYRVSE